MWFEAIAWADAAAPAAGPATGPQGFLDQMLANPMVPLVMVVAVFYFIIIRPQSQRSSEHSKLIKGLKRNDEVVTNGGIVGRVAEISDNLVTLYGKGPSKKDKGD
jgi:preprotein translocase subunit YajC